MLLHSLCFPCYEKILAVLSERASNTNKDFFSYPDISNQSSYKFKFVYLPLAQLGQHYDKLR